MAIPPSRFRFKNYFATYFKKRPSKTPRKEYKMPLQSLIGASSGNPFS